MLEIQRVLSLILIKIKRQTPLSFTDEDKKVQQLSNLLVSDDQLSAEFELEYG